MNKQLTKMTGITEEDYRNWCKENDRPSYKAETKQEFFEMIQNGQLVKDSSTGQLIKKRKRIK